MHQLWKPHGNNVRHTMKECHGPCPVNAYCTYICVCACVAYNLELRITDAFTALVNRFCMCSCVLRTVQYFLSMAVTNSSARTNGLLCTHWGLGTILCKIVEYVHNICDKCAREGMTHAQWALHMQSNMQGICETCTKFVQPGRPQVLHIRMPMASMLHVMPRKLWGICIKYCGLNEWKQMHIYWIGLKSSYILWICSHSSEIWKLPTTISWAVFDPRKRGNCTNWNRELRECWVQKMPPLWCPQMMNPWPQPTLVTFLLMCQLLQYVLNVRHKYF